MASSLNPSPLIGIRQRLVMLGVAGGVEGYGGSSLPQVPRRTMPSIFGKRGAVIEGVYNEFSMTTT